MESGPEVRRADAPGPANPLRRHPPVKSLITYGDAPIADPRSFRTCMCYSTKRDREISMNLRYIVGIILLAVLIYVVVVYI